MGTALPLHTAPPEHAARAARLHYVRGSAAGIERIGAKRCRYRLGDRWIEDAATLERIRHLAIPPAWTNVWICPNPDGHLQATGYDVKGRKQYRYHAEWSALRSQTKFVHALSFGAQLPAMRKRLEHDLRLPGLPPEKVMAAVVSIMDHTHIRIGQDAYAKANGSFGLSTLKDHHVKRDGACLRFVFVGKTGIRHNIRLGCSRLARLVMRCKELPGQDLFQYLDENGTPHPIDSGMVNAYIASITGGQFTSKNIRTWKGTVHCVRALLAEGRGDTVTERRMRINRALDEVAAALGNTRAVCRKYYVHPRILEAYETEELESWTGSVRAGRSMTMEERLVLRLLGQRGGPARRLERAA